MRLYYFPVAPNPTRLRLYLAEKAQGGCEIALEYVQVHLPNGEQNSPEHRTRNPLGRVPVLELDDGSYLCESLAIIEYFEELHPEPPMIGRTPLERARVRELERVAELGVLHPIARIVHASNSPLGLPPNPEVAEHFRGVLPAGLQLLDTRIGDAPFVAGEAPSIADCTLAAALQFGRFRGIGIDSDYANLARWDAAYRERASAKDIIVL
ncbi:MAG: glutathione S-transferase family protein [Deltaproteobacteria bacterium]|nr:glutathione S-transferase family protein [Deltaproteobacteria bacterium]